MHFTVVDCPTPRGSNETTLNFEIRFGTSPARNGRKSNPEPPGPPGFVSTDSFPSGEPLNARITAIVNVLPLPASFQSCGTSTEPHWNVTPLGRSVPELNRHEPQEIGVPVPPGT